MQKRRIAVPVLVILSVISIIFSQEKKPYPQQKDFPNCIKPNEDQVALDYYTSEMYKDWKTAYLRESEKTPEGYYVYSKGTGGTGNQITISEAHGYGMIAFALMAGGGDWADPQAQQYFDGMYWFYDDHRSWNNDYLMAWDIIAGESSPSNGSATDGDLDIAYALLLAHYQWGSTGDINYLQEAKDMIQSGIKAAEVSNDRPMLGDWYTYGYATRSSDWMTDHFHAFYEETKDGLWLDVIDEIFWVVGKITTGYSSTTGLMPDFVDGEDPYPVAANFLEGPNDGNYYWNACRYPWRMACDFAHYGTAEAKQACNKMLDWLIPETGNNPDETIMAGYKLDGTPLSEFTSLAFSSPFIAACIVNKGTNDLDYQGYLDKGWADMVREEPHDSYEASIRLLCALLLSGNWWRPEEGTNDITLQTDFTKPVDVSIRMTAAHYVVCSYTLNQATAVSIGIYDVSGALVFAPSNTMQRRGYHKTKIDLGKQGIANGIYFVKLRTGNFATSQKINLVR